MPVPWRHIKRSSAGLFRITSRCKPPQTRPLDQLSKNHSRPSALASTLFLSFGARCRSDARRHGLFEARLPRVRPLEVRRAVGLDRSFVRQLWRPLIAGATRPAANIMRSATLSRASLEAALPREPFTPRERASNLLSIRIHHPLDTHSAS